MISNIYKHDQHLGTAVILAAGTGTRLQPLTSQSPKCLTEVNGNPMLGQMLDSLLELDFQRVIIVIGYLGEQIREYARQDRWRDLNIEFVLNSDYASTNNIYSLYVTADRIHEGFLLLESDLVYDFLLLKDFTVPDRTAIAEYQSSMNGTAVAIDSVGMVSKFLISKRPTSLEFETLDLYKTVNIYSLSSSTWEKVKSELEWRMKAGKRNDYYEVVFCDLIEQAKISFRGISFDEGRWFEIDTLEDLKIAETLFSKSSKHHIQPIVIAPLAGVEI